MAFTVHQEPAEYSPAYNDLIFVVSSTNKTQANFNYIAKIYINSDVITLKAPPDPVYKSGVFNIGRIIESYVNSDIGDGTVGFQINTNSYASYYVKFGEEYGTTVTQYLNLVTTAVKYVWNGGVDFLEYQNYSFNNYSADGNKILSNTIDRCIEFNQDAWLYFVSKDTNSYDKAMVASYNSAGVLVRGVEIANLYVTSGTIGCHFLRFSAGTKNLNLTPTGVITNTYGGGDVVPTNAAYYIIGFDGGAASPTLRFNIGCGCSKYSTYRLHFLNKLGAFESFNFNGQSRKSSDITRNFYKAPIGGLTSASAFGYSKKDRSDRSYFVSAKDTLILRSNWLTDAESVWLQELVESPEIYLDDATHGLISMTCKNAKYDVKSSLNDKVFQLELELEYSFNRYRQRY